MTIATIPNELQPGRELDTFIAETFFNWEWWISSSTGRRCLFAPGRIPRSQNEWFLERATGEEALVGDWDRTKIPKYSTELVRAWQLVEKLKADGWMISLAINTDQYCCFLLMQLSDDKFHDISATDKILMSMAICKAAIKTIKDKVTDNNAR